MDIQALKLRRDWMARQNQIRMARGSFIFSALGTVIAPGAANQFLPQVDGLSLSLLVGTALSTAASSLVMIHARRKASRIHDSYMALTGESVNGAVIEEQLDLVLGPSLSSRAIDSSFRRV